MRKPAARPVGRRVDACQMSATRRAVRYHRALLIAKAERLADAVQMVIEVVDPEADEILIARPDRLIDTAEANEVAEAEVRIRLRHRPALDVVTVEQLFRCQAAQHISELP